MPNLKSLYQETILEHGQNPRNFGRIRKFSHSAEAFNPFCGDSCHVYLKMHQNNIKNISFEGEGCLLSKASGSLMTEILKNKTMKEGKEIFMFFQKLVKGEKHAKKTPAEKLAVFSGISQFPARVNCVLLPWYAAQKMLSMS